MELDDLKQSWKQEEGKQIQKQNIMELIHQKSRGPLASLKTAFRRQMITVSILLMAVVVTNGRLVETVPGHVLFYTFVAFCLSVILAFYLNYRITNKMESMDKNVKANLEEHILLLEKRLKWQYIGSRLVVVVLIGMVEILPLFYSARMLDKWHSVPPAVRFSAYAVYLAFVYFVSRSVKRRKFGRHLANLKSILRDTN